MQASTESPSLAAETKSSPQVEIQKELLAHLDKHPHTHSNPYYIDSQLQWKNHSKSMNRVHDTRKSNGGKIVYDPLNQI